MKTYGKKNALLVHRIPINNRIYTIVPVHAYCGVQINSFKRNPLSQEICALLYKEYQQQLDYYFFTRMKIMHM